MTLDDGTEITFVGAEEFANFQVSYDPTQYWVLAFTIVSLGALVGSLTVKRRRIWVRLEPVSDTETRVETAGLARTDRAGWGRNTTKFIGNYWGCRIPTMTMMTTPASDEYWCWWPIMPRDDGG